MFFSSVPYHFRGKKIVLEIVKQVVRSHQTIKQATRITLSGDSAGGMGTQLNGDRVGDLLNELLPDANFDYRMVADSAWFNPGPSLKNYDCTKTWACNIEFRTKLGQNLWNLQPDDSCTEKKGQEKRWECTFLGMEGVF